MKKSAKLGLWLLGFVVLGLLGLWLSHERAKARLEAYKQQLIAKGEKLAIADHVPKLPPALANAAPDFIAAASRLTDLKPEFQPQRMRLVAPGRARVTWQQAELPTDKEPDLWPIVAAHVEGNRVLLAEMAIALERPEMVFDLDYSKGFSLMLPHLQKFRLAASTFAGAVVVDLHSGQTNSAFTNLLAGVSLVRRYEEPLLISQLVRIACAQIAVGATWEALQHPGWNAGQLRQLQILWQTWDLHRGWQESAGMERALGLFAFAQCRASPRMLTDLGGYSSTGSSRPFFEELFHNPGEAAKQAAQFSVGLSWSLWLSYDDERWALDSYQVWLDGARRILAADAFAPGQARTATASKPFEHPPTTMVLSRLIVPSLGSSHLKLATFETVRRLTVTAIALHRHRLQHGKFPASLGALVPEFLAEAPRDFMDGQPLRYKVQPDGQFLLWSVGEDFKDDGGDPPAVGVASSSDPYQWLKGRDWVWPQAATEAEVAVYHADLAAKRALKPPAPTPP